MDAQEQSNRLYDREAGRYEDEAGHGIGGEEEREAWRRDLAPALARFPGTRVVDVGAGTGVLSRLLAEQGFVVEGIDASAGMVAEARRRLPPKLADRVSFRVGDTHEDLFPAGSFDAVVSRQVVCHLRDPLRAFRHWHRWLKPEGVAVVVDGFWPRHGWSSGELAGLVDLLPLSCVQTLGTVAYLLTEAGFSVEHRGWMEGVNRQVAAAEPVATERRPRYLVVARKAD
jgi:ubiquinone/menaquinone biosynthesis C-methylase UbiE